MQSDQNISSLSSALARLASRRQLPPWEEITFAQSPNVIVTGLSGTAPTWAPIAPNNPNRIALVLSATATIRITPDSTIATSAGITINANQAPFILTEKDYLNLATVQWFGFANQGTSVTAIEVILREFPGGSS